MENKWRLGELHSHYLNDLFLGLLHCIVASVYTAGKQLKTNIRKTRERESGERVHQ